jgi:hypothetical protein
MSALQLVEMLAGELGELEFKMGNHAKPSYVSCLRSPASILAKPLKPLRI